MINVNDENSGDRNSQKEIVDVVFRQRQFFNTGATVDYEVRTQSLTKLKRLLALHEKDLHAALKKDLGKPEYESYVSETGFCRHELTETLRNLKKWMKPKRVRTPLLAQPGISRIEYSPLGVTLIIGPYNYPITLVFSPLIAVIAAGNTAVLKPSELTPHCSEVIHKMVSENFPPEYIACIGGEAKEVAILLQQKFDHIFFTGSPRVGSIVMTAAAKHLTPVTLELGGKSPCIVHHDANQEIAVKRIVSGKFLNAGQTCIAPDYVLVHKDIKEPFLDKLKSRIIESYGEDPIKSADYGRIINDKHFDRICALIDRKKITIGGQIDASSRFIAPTVLRDVSLDDRVMSEEIFGPVLPVLDFTDLNDVYRTIGQLPQHPLALYIFSNSGAIQDELVSKIQFGGGCINNCVLHLVNPYLPFGGVGESGIGAYHGFHGFERFSHKKGVLKSASWIDFPVLYPPYGNKIKLMRKLIK